MKQVCVWLAAVASLLIGVARAQTDPLRLYYTDAEIRNQCSKAQDINDLSPTHYRSLSDGVSFQTPLGSVFSICNYYYDRLEPTPSVATLRRNNYGFLVFLSGSVRNYSDVDGVRAVLVTRSGTKETARLQPTLVSPNRESWDPDCSGIVCVWRGRNTISFRVTPDTAVYKRLKAGDLLYVIYTLGSGPMPALKVGALEGTASATAEQKLLKAVNGATAAQARQEAANLREKNTPMSTVYSYVMLDDFATSFGAVLETVGGRPKLTHEGVAYTFTLNSSKVYTPTSVITMVAPLVMRGEYAYIPARFFTQIGCTLANATADNRDVHVTCPVREADEPLGFDFRRY